MLLSHHHWMGGAPSVIIIGWVEANHVRHVRMHKDINRPPDPQVFVHPQELQECQTQLKNVTVVLLEVSR